MLEITYSSSDQLVLKAIKLWERYAEEYRNLPRQYRRLLAEKKRLKIQPIRPINKRDMKEYPVISLLDISEERDAVEHILKMTAVELACVVRFIEIHYVDAPIRRTLRGRIRDYKSQISFSQSRKTPLAMSPDCCGRCQTIKPRKNGRKLPSAE